jgi:hypothetical protein
MPSSVRGATVSPVAASSERARLAQGSAPRRSNVSRAARRCVLASDLCLARRSLSPKQSSVRARSNGVGTRSWKPSACSKWVTKQSPSASRPRHRLAAARTDGRRARSARLCRRTSTAPASRRRPLRAYASSRSCAHGTSTGWRISCSSTSDATYSSSSIASGIRPSPSARSPRAQREYVIAAPMPSSSASSSASPACRRQSASSPRAASTRARKARLWKVSCPVSRARRSASAASAYAGIQSPVRNATSERS